MTRKIATFFVLCLFVASLPLASALGAKAVKLSKSQSTLDVASESANDRLQMVNPSQQQATGKAGVVEEVALGYMGPDAGSMQIGRTYYDYQHNGTMGRMIAQGADGRVHFAYMRLPSYPQASTRAPYYNSAVFTGITWNLSHTDPGIVVESEYSGYVQAGVWNNRGVVAYHATDTLDLVYKSWTKVDNSSGGGNWSIIGGNPTPPANCEGVESGGQETNEYIWPKLDVKYSGGNGYIHMLSSEYDTIGQASLVYNRATSIGAGMYGTCAKFVDSIVSTGYVPVADPNGDKVALVWTKQKYDENDTEELMAFSSRLYSDIVYWENSNNGDPSNWGTVTNITNYPKSYNTTDSTYAVADVTALYDAEHYLHVVWMSGQCWPDEAGEETIWYYPEPGALWHWSQRPEQTGAITQVAQSDNNPCGNNENASTGTFNREVAKPNLVECGGNLYVTYTHFTGINPALGGPDDCSAGGYANGDICARASASNGLTWGPEVNLTSTNSNGCAAGSCFSEHWASSVRYADSLYIMYIEDKDAGGWAGGGANSQGAVTDNPVIFRVHPCFPMETFVTMEVSPEGFIDPFNTQPNVAIDTTFTLTNLGNDDANWSHTITYLSGTNWLSLAPGSGSIPPAVNNTGDVTLTATGPATEGLYQAVVNISHNDTKATIEIPVDLYCFTNFYLPENATIRTNANELTVQQVSRVGVQDLGSQMEWFSNNDVMLYDGSLVIGYDANNLFTNIFYELGDTVADDNPLRELRALGPTGYDSTSYPYRYATGLGCTADSTIGFMSEFYASKHPDSGGFYVGTFKLYPGPNAVTDVDINDVLIGYATDWDVPSDTGSDNRGHADAARQLVYQQGYYLGSPDGNDYKFGGIAYRGGPNAPDSALGGFYWENDVYVYPDEATNSTGGYHADSLWTYMTHASTWGPQPEAAVADSIEDLNCVISIADDISLTWTASVRDTVEFYIIFAGDITGVKTDAGLKISVDKAEKFICEYVNPEAAFCEDCKCGDADGNTIWNISDAVFLIAYIFGGGPAPDPLCLGDADGNGIVNISDAVYLIAYIFGGGPEPHCP